MVPRELKDNAFAKFGGGGGKQVVLWEMCKWGIRFANRKAQLSSKVDDEQRQVSVLFDTYLVSQKEST